MEHTKLPLTTRLLAIYLISQAKTGLSASAMKRHLGVTYLTAWPLHHTINRAMAAREIYHLLEGTVCRSLMPTSVASTRVASPGAARKTRYRSWLRCLSTKWTGLNS